MDKDTKVTAKPSLALFLDEKFLERKREIKRQTFKSFSQKEFAEEMGMLPQSFGRFLAGERSMTGDNAIRMLKYFGPDVLPHFEFSENGLDEDSATFIAYYSRLRPEQREEIKNLLLGGNARGQETNNSALQPA